MLHCSNLQMCTSLQAEHLVNTWHIANVPRLWAIIKKINTGKIIQCKNNFSLRKSFTFKLSSLVVTTQLNVQSLITFITEYIRGPGSCEHHWWFSSEDWNEHVNSSVQSSKEGCEQLFYGLELALYLVSSMILKFECQEIFIIMMPDI